MFGLGYKCVLSLSKFLTAFWASQSLGKKKKMALKSLFVRDNTKLSDILKEFCSEID